MQFFEAIQNVSQSDENDVSSDAYLAHVFKMFDDANAGEWQVGYYSPQSDEVTVFTVSQSEGVRKNPPAEAFKREETTVRPLKAELLQTAPKEAISLVHDRLGDKHAGHPVKQTILLAQTLDDHGQVYNITVITETFHMYNVKVDTASGEVVDESFDHLLSLKKE